MIELQMVYRMMKRGALVAPIVVLPFFIWGGGEAGLSALIGIVMALLNLLISGRIIGGIAENKPGLLLPAAMVAFMLGLAVLTAIAFGLQTLDFITFKVTGLVLIGSHLGLVLWEAARAYPVKVERERPGAEERERPGAEERERPGPNVTSANDALDMRS